MLVSCNGFTAEKTKIRIGVLAFGTVDWELSAIQNDPATASADFQLDIQRLANPEAGKIALQSGSVDMIVSDWIWVSKLRATGSDFTFYPYSTTSGALVVADASPIRTLKDLKGKRLGIAGGELDKNWLLLQALAKKDQLDLNSDVDKVFGAPPLLNEQIRQTASMPCSITGISRPGWKRRTTARSSTAKASSTRWVLMKTCPPSATCSSTAGP
jgi:NitT/TauT family transport system substrate-binding protein